MTARRLPQIVSRLARLQDVLSEASADFWKRAIVDCITATIFQSLPPDEPGTLPSALRLVHNVEDYLAAAGARPVHVSELCAAFRVSRRGLHRAFHDVFGIGPITFPAPQAALRHSFRLSGTVTLRRVTVAQVAIQHGFIELGRFSHYYRSLFGEYPSETLGAHPPRARREAGPHFAGPLPLGLDAN